MYVSVCTCVCSHTHMLIYVCPIGSGALCLKHVSSSIKQRLRAALGTPQPPPRHLCPLRTPPPFLPLGFQMDVSSLGARSCIPDRFCIFGPLFFHSYRMTDAGNFRNSDGQTLEKWHSRFPLGYHVTNGACYYF